MPPFVTIVLTVMVGPVRFIAADLGLVELFVLGFELVGRPSLPRALSATTSRPQPLVPDSTGSAWSCTKGG